MSERTVTKPPQAVEARSLLTQVVETDLFGPERFKGKQQGEVVEIQRIGEIVGTLRKLGDHYEAEFYGPGGKSWSLSLDPTKKDLGARIGDARYVSVDPSNQDNADYKPNVGFESMGYSTEEAKVLEDSFYRIAKTKGANNVYVDRNTFDSWPDFYIPTGDWKMGVLFFPGENDSEQPRFVFTAGGQWLSIDPKDPTKKAFFNTPPESIGNTVSKKGGEISENLLFECEESTISFTDKNGSELTSFSGIDAKIDPVEPTKVYFINTGRVYSLDTSGVNNRTSKPILVDRVKVSDPVEIEFDPHGNFLLVRDEKDQLHVLDKETGEEVKQFEGVVGPVYVDAQGDIIFAGTDNKLREIQTNFQAIPMGGSEAAQKKRSEELQQLRDRFASLNLEEVSRRQPSGVGITEKAVEDTLRQTIARQVSEKITQGSNPEELEDILDRLQALKNDPANRAYGQVIDEFVDQAKGKLNGLQLEGLEKQLEAFDFSLNDVQSVGDTIGLDEQYAKLLELRQKIEIGDVNKRRELERRIKGIEGRKDALIGKYQGELTEAAQTTLPQIEDLIRETGSLEELGAFGTTSESLKFETMLANIRDPQVRRELRDRLNQIRAEQRGKLESTGRQLEDQQRMRWAEVVEEAREDLDTIREQILTLGDTRDVDRFGRNPLVTAWRAKLYALPPELREAEEKRLEMIMGTRKKDLEHRRDLGAIGEGDELKFGNATFPIYKEPPILWQAKLVPIGAGMYADLIFEDSLGRVFRPDGEGRTVVSPDPNDERTKQAIEKYKKAADEYFRSIKREVPDFDEHWRITPYHMTKLEEIAEGLNLQLDNHRGILILQGEAGTGKNVVVDMLANLSDREVIPVLCNENSVKEDLTYEFYYDPEKGTYKLPSRLVEGIQKPGTIILFDEINALKPGIAKMLNSLFDYRRRIYLPEGGKQREIVTDPSVLFMGTMNPQNYAGVNRLSPEVKSRARVVDFDYPPFEERGNRTHYKSDEAEMLGAYVDSTGDLKANEFRLCWDYIVNRDTSNGADAILGTNPQIEQDVRRIYDVIRVANRLREMYRAYLIGDSNEPMDFPTSLREVTDIVMEMNHRQGLKRIIKRVIIPKIDDLQQKRLVDQTIDAVLPGA